MGYWVIIYGRIEGSGDPVRQRYGKFEGALYQHNRLVLEALPDTDEEWPFLTRHMFALASPKLGFSFDRGISGHQIVHFGARLKLRDMNSTAFVEEWLTKFEQQLLRPLVWLSAAVHFEHDVLGRCDVRYEVETQSLQAIHEEFREVGSRVEAETVWRRHPDRPGEKCFSADLS